MIRSQQRVFHIMTLFNMKKTSRRKKRQRDKRGNYHQPSLSTSIRCVRKQRGGGRLSRKEGMDEIGHAYVHFWNSFRLSSPQFPILLKKCRLCGVPSPVHHAWEELSRGGVVEAHQ